MCVCVCTCAGVTMREQAHAGVWKLMRVCVCVNTLLNYTSLDAVLSYTSLCNYKNRTRIIREGQRIECGNLREQSPRNKQSAPKLIC